MKRLTMRNKHGEAITAQGVTKPRYLERLAEYEEAEKDGLLVRFPCKVGDSDPETAISALRTMARVVGAFEGSVAV